MAWRGLGTGIFLINFRFQLQNNYLLLPFELNSIENPLIRRHCLENYVSKFPDMQRDTQINQKTYLA